MTKYLKKGRYFISFAYSEGLFGNCDIILHEDNDISEVQRNISHASNNKNVIVLFYQKID